MREWAGRMAGAGKVEGEGECGSLGGESRQDDETPGVSLGCATRRDLVAIQGTT